MIGAAVFGLGFAVSPAFAAKTPKPPKPPVEEPAPWETRPNDLKLDLIRNFLAEGNDQEALQLIAAMRQSGLTLPDLDLLQGIALRNQGVDSEAERLLVGAEKKMPRDARPYRELCILYADSRRVEEAIAACHRASELQPADASVWNNLGFLYLGADRPDDALTALQRATDIDGSEVRYRNNLGFALAAVGRYDDALRTFLSTGSEAQAHYNLGVAYDHAGRSDDAADSWRHALQVDPDCAEARAALDELVQSQPGADPAGGTGSTGAPP